MSTRKLAKELGILRQRSQSSNGSKKSLVSNQTFSYLIVIDFESTCWREKNNYSQEIIEFPAVLLNTSTGEVESEFHTYVQPQEHPVLSEFCTELTGITQVQVEAGIPLQICLSRFSRWLQNLQLNMGVVFTNRQQMTSAPSPSQKLCTFLTWSDWDLGVCLQYECKRKQLHKPDVLNSWIDLRSTYRLFYDRKPKGLNGALQDLGIQFAGREHSGLDDARNTAKLAARMMRDGCVMKITRSLVRNPLMVKPKFGNTNAENKKEKSDTVKEEKTLATDKPSSSKMPPESCRNKSSSVSVTKENSNLVQGSVQKCQSLISPKTLLNGTNTPPWGLNNRSVATTKAVTNVSSLTKKKFPSPHDIKTSSSSLVLCPTTVGSFSSQPQTNQQPKTEETEEGVELLVETEDRCGSYDEVVLGGDDVSETEKDFNAVYVSDLEGGCYVWEEPDNTHSSGGQDALRDNMRETVSVKNNVKTQKMTRRTHFTNNTRTHVNGLNHVKENGQHSTISEPNTYFAVPKPVNQNSKTNQHKKVHKTTLHVQEKSNVPDENAKTNTPFLFRHKPFMPGKTSTPLSSFIRPKPVITQHTNDKRIPTTSFTIFTDPAKAASPSSSGSFCTSKNVLSSLSTNTLSSRTNISSIAGSVKSGQRVTSPLCACGRRAKRQVVSNGGPNHGRVFYCCPVRRSGSGCRVQKGCEFFKWESAVMKSSSVASPAVGSSVSLCQINSTLSHRPPNKSTIRKSY